MIIEIYSKSFAVTQTIENAQGPVPRVGEAINLQQDGGYLQGVTDLIVYEVEYILKNDTLTPLVKCTVFATPENRLFRLKEHGWLKGMVKE